MTIEMVLRYGPQCIPIELRSFNALQSQGIPEGGKTGQVLKKRSDKDYDADWQDDVRGTGGTIVTIDGKAQGTFPADTYINESLDKRIGDISAALDEIIKLQEQFLVNNLFNLSALADDPTVTVDGESLYVDPSNGGMNMHNRYIVTEKTLKEVCPQVEVGKTYKISWKPKNGSVNAAVGYPDPQYCIVPYGAITGNPLEVYPNGEFTFTCTEQMLGRGFEIYSQFYDDWSLEGNYAYGGAVTFTDIMLTEV